SDSRYHLGGNWMAKGYDIFPYGSLAGYSRGPQSFLGAIEDPGHPIAHNVTSFDGGQYSLRPAADSPVRGRAILRSSDGRILAGVHNFRRRADLGFFPASEHAAAGNWGQRTDGARIIANALQFVIEQKPCPGDFNGDRLVDDADFELFVEHYENLVDVR